MVRARSWCHKSCAGLPETAGASRQHWPQVSECNAKEHNSVDGQTNQAFTGNCGQSCRRTLLTSCCLVKFCSADQAALPALKPTSAFTVGICMSRTNMLTPARQHTCITQMRFTHLFGNVEDLCEVRVVGSIWNSFEPVHGVIPEYLQQTKASHGLCCGCPKQSCIRCTLGGNHDQRSPGLRTT